jgi:hypothetical protein
VPIGEAGYQRGTPQDTNTCNFVPNREFQGWDKGTRNCLCNGTTLCQGPCAEFAARAGACCYFQLNGAPEIRLVR